MNKKHIQQAGQVIIRITEITGYDDAALIVGAWAAIDETGTTEPPADLMPVMLSALSKARQSLSERGQIRADEIEAEIEAMDGPQ